MIETDKTIKGQFIQDAKLSGNVRRVLELYDEMELRNLEKEILTLLVHNQLMLKKSTERTVQLTNLLKNEALANLQNLSNRGE